MDVVLNSTYATWHGAFSGMHQSVDLYTCIEHENGEQYLPTH